MDSKEENVQIDNLNTEKIEEKNEKSNSKEIKSKQFDNINSPKIIQDILRLTTHSSKIENELQNNIINSFLTINQTLLPLLDEEINEEKFNPFILKQNKRNSLYDLQFERINSTNNFLNEKIGQYNDLKLKISEYNNNIKSKETDDDKLNTDNQEKKSENEEEIDKKEEISKKLYLVGHPLISLFEEQINFKELKNEISNEYKSKMKDNTNYKYTIPHHPELPPIINQFLNPNENLEEINEMDIELDEDDNDNNSEEDSPSEEDFDDNVVGGDEEEVEIIHLPLNQNDNNNVNNQNINNSQEHQINNENNNQDQNNNLNENENNQNENNNPIVNEDNNNQIENENNQNENNSQNENNNQNEN